MSKTEIEGRVWVLLDGLGALIEDIDTDQIFHNAYLHLTDIKQMGPYALGNLEGWKDFPAKAKPGDILVAGRNFGAGSSRQQAVDCFMALGLAAILAPSFGAIYFRNAVNSGLPVLRSRALEGIVREGKLVSGDKIKVDGLSGRAGIAGRAVTFEVVPMSRVQADILAAGNLFLFGRTLQKSGRP
ncbi:MAG: 3-isopropylmalate dehydratase [Candidatus Aminicenantales bacterium]|jgi:3-isopropylmalate/(R)-2-methylmalate dehydratase small subunit